jgi:uncharacterized ParB-like nuclease family protein
MTGTLDSIAPKSFAGQAYQDGMSKKEIVGRSAPIVSLGYALSDGIIAYQNGDYSEMSYIAGTALPQAWVLGRGVRPAAATLRSVGVPDYKIGVKPYSPGTLYSNPLDQLTFEEVVTNSEANILRGVDPKTLNRSHEISGGRSSSRVNDIAASMRQSGYNGPPIDVVEHNGQYYIIDGHHRAAAARRTSTAVDIRVVDDVANHPSSYKSVEEVVRDAQLLGPDRLTHPNRHKK